MKTQRWGDNSRQDLHGRAWWGMLRRLDYRDIARFRALRITTCDVGRCG